MNEHRTMFRKKWKALCLLPFVGLLAGCNIFDGPSFDDDISSDHNVSRYLDELPYESHIGANKFGCYMDGEVMASQGCFQASHFLDLSHIEYVRGFGGLKPDGSLSYADLRFNTKGADFQMEFSSTSMETSTCQLSVYGKEDGLSGIVSEAFVEVTYFNSLMGVISGCFGPVDVPMYDKAGNWVKTVCLTDGLFDVQMYW